MTKGDRLKKIQSHLKAHHFDLAVISSPADIRYLTQIALCFLEREATLYVTPTACVLLHSPLLTIRSSDTITAQPALASTTRNELISRLVASKQPFVGVQETDLRVSELKSLKSSLKQASFVDISDICINARSVKSASEIKSLRKAGSITATVMNWAIRSLGAPISKTNQSANTLTTFNSANNASELEFLAQNAKKLMHQNALSEIKFAQHIEMASGLLGSHDLAFPVHVAFDTHTASPHHQPGEKVIEDNSIVMLDFGAKVDGYCADMTRTFCLSPTPPQSFLAIKKIVDSAFFAASEALASKRVLASQVDEAARKVIAEAGHAKHFPHSTGHGVGLEIHEQPSLNPLNHQVLQKGMVVTIEPGIYIKNKFGYRTEDTMLITA